MAQPTYNFDLTRYADYHLIFTYTDENDAAIDLSAYTGRVTVRSVNRLDLIQEYLNTGPNLSLGADGVVDCNFEGEDTGAWAVTAPKYWCYLTPAAGGPVLVLTGTITVNPGGAAA